MEQSEFAAWSLYTGPSKLRPVINDPNCPWVVGQWTGSNNGTSPDEVKNDIEARISLLKAVFLKTLPLYKDKTLERYFVIPEFYFHCKQGPYPNIKIDGKWFPVEYIRLRLSEELLKIVPLDSNFYNVVIGSILTCNIDDYDTFLCSELVNQRLTELNQVLPNELNIVQSKDHKSWVRTFDFKSQENSSDDLTALNNFMKQCRADPLCTVRNRGIYFRYNKDVMNGPEAFVYEKQCESTVDLTMGILDENHKIVTGDMITEWMANYPSYSIIKGDKQTDKYSTNSRFTPPDMNQKDIGAEICLDHRLQRLRRTVDMCKENGADADNFPLTKQIIPSGGMQILDYSVAANKSSVIFNADGCDKVFYVYGDESSVILKGEAGVLKDITCGVYNWTIQSKWRDTDNNIYYSHSQLAFTTDNSAIGGFDNSLGFKNKKALTYNGPADKPYNKLTESYSPCIKNMQEKTDLFAATTGELHFYQST